MQRSDRAVAHPRDNALAVRATRATRRQATHPPTAAHACARRLVRRRRRRRLSSKSTIPTGPTSPLPTRGWRASTRPTPGSLPPDSTRLPPVMAGCASTPIFAYGRSDRIAVSAPLRRSSASRLDVSIFTFSRLFHGAHCASSSQERSMLRSTFLKTVAALVATFGLGLAAFAGGATSHAAKCCCGDDCKCEDCGCAGGKCTDCGCDEGTCTNCECTECECAGGCCSK